MAVFADVILFDSIGSPYTGKTLEESGMGGSEFQSILLLESLAKTGKKVICLNNTTQEFEYNGVSYLPNILIQKYEFKCNNLILHRHSIIPKILHRKCIVWVTDLNGPHNLQYYDLLENNKCNLVTLSNFQNNLFPKNWNKTVIHFMIPDWVYNYEIPRNKKDYIYASSLMKGYNATLQYWAYLKSAGLLSNKKLKVCLPGYDNPKTDISIKNLDVEYLGSLTFKDVVKTIAECKGMFYVNSMPETFGISVVLAEILQTTPYVYGLNGLGALSELLNSPTITTDMKEFINYFKDEMKINVAPYVFKSDNIIKKWEEILVTV